MIPDTHKHYYGDETRWFVGKVVQSHGDPEELGRIKVRIYGVHPDNQADAEAVSYTHLTLPTNREV